MDAHSLVGRKLGNGQYLLRALIALGGMGAVYLGEDLVLKRLVAIKVLQPTLTDPGFAQRFDQEATTAAALDHPNIVKVYNRGSENGLHYLVMQHLSGGSLQQRLAQASGLPTLSETAQMIAQVARALDYAHRRGVIHRDIKTSNIMFDEHGNAILVDFGIAKLTQQAQTLTQTGMAVGTPPYMAPEQAMGIVPTPAADQYSLGVVLYVLLTGRLPFEAPSPFAIQQKKLNEPLTPAYTFRSDLPPVLNDVLERSLAPQPEARFPNVLQFSYAVSEAVHGYDDKTSQFFSFLIQTDTPRPSASSHSSSSGSGTPPQGAGSPRSGRGWLMPLVTVGVILLLGVLGLLFIPPFFPPAATPTAAPTVAGLVAVISTEMPTETSTSTPTSTQTSTPTTAAPTPTQTSTATSTSTATATASSTHTPTVTPTTTSTTAPTASATAPPTFTHTLTSTSTHTPSATATPTASATLTATAPPTMTATPSPTFTATSTALPTETPTDTATAAALITPTVTPTFIPLTDPVALPESQILFRDEFVDQDALEREWVWWGERPSVSGGQLDMRGDGRDQGIARLGLSMGQGSLLLFQYGGTADQLYVDSGEWGSAAYRHWGITRYEGETEWSAITIVGSNFTTLQRFSLEAGQWYYVLFYVAPDGQFHTRIWQRDNPREYVFALSTSPVGDNWSSAEWRFVMSGISPTYRVESFEQLLFGEGYQLPSQPPSLLAGDCVVRTTEGQRAIYVGPGGGRAVRGALAPNVIYRVSGRNEDAGLWWRLEWGSATPGEEDRYWVSEADVIESGNCASVGRVSSSEVVPMSTRPPQSTEVLFSTPVPGSPGSTPAPGDVGAPACDFGNPSIDCDGDGFSNGSDQCPGAAGGMVYPYHSAPVQGCPDSDGDGYPDIMDACPSVNGGYDCYYKPVSCPIPDSDGDGIPACADACDNYPDPTGACAPPTPTPTP